MIRDNPDSECLSIGPLLPDANPVGLSRHGTAAGGLCTDTEKSQGRDMRTEERNGYILLAKSIFSSEIADMPLFFRWIWLYLLGKAEYREHANWRLTRGQVLVTLDELARVCSWPVGYRIVGPSRRDAWRACEWLRERDMITTTKTTRGVIVSIRNYNRYQNPASYENDNEGATNATMKRQRRDTNSNTIVKEGTKEEGKKKEEHTPPASPSDTEFDEFYKAYPRKVGKGAAIKAWGKIMDRPPVNILLSALTWQRKTLQWTRDDGQYIPHPATWLNRRQWEDEPCEPESDLPSLEGRPLTDAEVEMLGWNEPVTPEEQAHYDNLVKLAAERKAKQEGNANERQSATA